ncbi:MAG: sugar phosphate isomerase/epimerase [Clostridia bacterium]|nr:sugar phosphate isomerase/epimerase [Clostridia bacterium]
MQVSVWSSYFIELSPEDMVREFSAGGFSATEFSDEHGLVMLARGNPEKEGEKLRAFAAEQGFSFPQGHMLLRADICSDGAVEILKPWCDLFLALGVRSGVLHAAGGAELSPEARFEKRANTLTKLTEYVRGSDFTICLENLRGATVPVTADELNALINTVGDANLGICLDTGHLNIPKGDGRDESQRSFIAKAGKRLKALHIADNDGSSDQHLMPYGRGRIDWREVMTALGENGYDRLFNMEIPGENRCPLEVRREKLKYCRAVCDYLTGLAVTNAGVISPR